MEFKGPPDVMDDEFAIGMEFNSRESVIKAIKEYTIRKGDHSKLDSDMIAEAIKSLFESDPSIKDGNDNIVSIAFAIVEGETSDA
ncbi:hypothetical protein PIB30_066518 [Stylosanthes scabra]|uniref:Uncharacterized protein n=1 Tax=Stylosanthes scabra TaxID=79078 RepID=A0ABU6QNF0_9FABA|nr:hypothetical protein [Stylosanthes scabra]